MNIEMILGEGSINAPIHIQQVPPGVWKFKAQSILFQKDILKDIPESIREMIYSAYPAQKLILQQLFNGDDAFWSKIRQNNVPQIFFYILIDGNR